MTRKIVILALVSLQVFLPYALAEEAKADAEVSLSLEDVISTAFKNNRDIQLRQLDIQVARADISGAKSEFLPKLNVNAAYTHNADILKLSSSAGKKDIGIFSGYKNDNKLGISIDENIYNGGSSIAGLKKASLALSSSVQTLRAEKLDVEFEAKRLYYGLFLAYETQDIAQELVTQARSHYEDVEKKFAQGTSSKFDLLQSKVQVSKIMPELIKAKNAVDLIAAELKKLLGFKIKDSIKLQGSLEYSPIEIKEEEFLKQAYLNKPEMVLKALGVDLNKWSIEMAKSGWRPQVNAELGYSYRSNNLGNMFNNRHSNWNTGFTVIIPVFDGFSTKAKVDAARQRYAQAALEKEDLAQRIAVDIRGACLDLIQAASIIDSSKDAIEEAKEALRIAEVSYDNGEGTNLDVLDTQVSLSQIEKNYSEGIYDYLMAKASLDRSMGKSSLGEAGDEKKD